MRCAPARIVTPQADVCADAACALLKELRIADTHELAVKGCARDREAQLRAYAGRFAAGERDAGNFRP
jgi:hypothetical protein